MNEILLIASILALAGAVAGFALVRREDFVAAETEAEPAAVAA